MFVLVLVAYCVVNGWIRPSLVVWWIMLFHPSMTVTIDRALNVKWPTSIDIFTVQYGICALGKAHMRSTPSLRSFPSVAHWNSSSVRLTDDDRLAFPLSTPTLLQAIDGAMSLALCPQVVSQAKRRNLTVAYNSLTLLQKSSPHVVKGDSKLAKASPRVLPCCVWDIVSQTCLFVRSVVFTEKREPIIMSPPEELRFETKKHF